MWGRARSVPSSASASGALRSAPAQILRLGLLFPTISTPHRARCTDLRKSPREAGAQPCNTHHRRRPSRCLLLPHTLERRGSPWQRKQTATEGAGERGAPPKPETGAESRGGATPAGRIRSARGAEGAGPGRPHDRDGRAWSECHEESRRSGVPGWGQSARFCKSREWL